MATGLNKKKEVGAAFVTMADCVYTDNTSFTMQDMLNAPISFAEIQQMYPQCKRFRGSFNWNTLTETKFSDAQVGDFWLNDQTERVMGLHCYLHYPNDIMYYNGSNVEPLHLPHNKETARQEQYDVVIVGGGAGGMGCAYALKDKGYRVCLIEKNDMLGGTHIHGAIPVLISSPITGNWFKNICADGYESGDIKFYGNGVKKGTGTEFEQYWIGGLKTTDGNNRGTQWIVPYWWTSQRYYKDLSPTIEILLRTEFIESILDPTDSSVILGIKVRNLDTGKEYIINGQYFVDCSADGVLCRSNKKEGVDFFIGTDPKTRFNEAAYPDNYEGNRYQINTVEAGYRTMGDTYLPSDLTRTENRSAWKTFPDVTAKSNGGGSFDWHTVKSTSTGCAIDPHIFIDCGNDVAHAFGYYKSLAHHAISDGSGVCYAEQCKMLGIRESYRINCDRMLTQADCGINAANIDFATQHTIALSSWYADIHNDSGLQGSVENSWLNAIPYESLVPVAFKNVLVGSRCFGCSHIAQTSYRLTKVMMSIGYACGHAMAQCVARWLTDVRNVDIATLQADVEINELMDTIRTYWLS